jgi:hypothetical protein
MSKSTLMILVGLFLGGIGLGAGTAAALLALSGAKVQMGSAPTVEISESNRDQRNSNEPSKSADFDHHLACEADALASISVSLKQVGRLGKVANNPLPHSCQSQYQSEPRSIGATQSCPLAAN